MKYLLLVWFLFVVSGCQTGRQVVMPNGMSYTDNGHLAGNTTVIMKPDGTTILHNKMNEPWKDTMQLIGAALVAKSGENVSDTFFRSREVTRLGAQRSAIERARLANDLEKLRLAQEFEKFKILNPLPSSLP